MSQCNLIEINEDFWPQILQIQAEVYVDIEPEALETLRSKWLNSPQCCTVYTVEQDVCAYLLAHTWHSDSPPKLYQSTPALPFGDVLFIHDLAVSTRAAGMGVGKRMVNNLLKSAKTQGYHKVLLVAVQNSVPFWRKLGFELATVETPCLSYGNDAHIMSLRLADLLKQ